MLDVLFDGIVLKTTKHDNWVCSKIIPLGDKKFIDLRVPVNNITALTKTILLTLSVRIVTYRKHTTHIIIRKEHDAAPPSQIELLRVLISEKHSSLQEHRRYPDRRLFHFRIDPEFNLYWSPELFKWYGSDYKCQLTTCLLLWSHKITTESSSFTVVVSRVLRRRKSRLRGSHLKRLPLELLFEVFAYTDPFLSELRDPSVLYKRFTILPPSFRKF